MGNISAISPLTKKKFKPKGSAVSDQLLLCSHSGRCLLKVWSLFSARIFKNMMNNYAWALFICWKTNIVIYFIRCYWIKNLLSTVIQNKKYLVVFHKHEINSLHIYYLINCVIFGLVFVSLCKIEYFGTLLNIYLRFEISFCYLPFLKDLRTYWCFSYSL